MLNLEGFEGCLKEHICLFDLFLIGMQFFSTDYSVLKFGKWKKKILNMKYLNDYFTNLIFFFFSLLSKSSLFDMIMLSVSSF